MSTPLAGVRLAVGLLSVVPAGRIDTPTRDTARWAMLLAPLAIAPVATAVAVLIGLGASLRLPVLLVGLLAVGVEALLTRALHLDGLADTVDGLGSGREREGALAIMRRGDIGPMGVVTLVAVLGLQAAAYAGLVTAEWGGLVAGATVCAARTALPLLTRESVPSARPEGLGALVAGAVPSPAALLVTTVAFLGCLAVVAAGDGPTTAPWLGGSWLLGLCALWRLQTVCTRRLGGITGDVLGAGVLILQSCLLVGLAIGVTR